ncbi:threonine-phosphate decarboxylase CobD [Flexibacterium corallicola]|uniref:threonine-phosphate decarboxylase CobD n=1 Tax=Flexibacterium corallicola TaxID=3037259 RepID=UPI00286F8371|nr:threonine-phosphate decarboxylase CobD [Pseudovibrio sp. M1P-2-3]
MKHGGDLSKAICQYGGTRDEWLDLSTGINPQAYPLDLSLVSPSLEPLPEDGAHDALITAARSYYRVPSHLHITAAPGTQSLLHRLPSYFEPQPVAIFKPTYTSHAESWENAGFTVCEVTHISQVPQGCKLVVLVNPNNPDGRSYSHEEILELSKTLKQQKGLLIVDEAFAEITPNRSILPHVKEEPVLVLRSFGKFFGLAGLRLGFAIGHKAITDYLEHELGSWAVSGPALSIGATALADTKWQEDMLQKLEIETSAFHELLKTHGLAIKGSTSLYTLVEAEDALALHQSLAKHHIWTRVFDYNSKWIRFGLPKNEHERARVQQALLAHKEQV